MKHHLISLSLSLFYVVTAAAGLPQHWIQGNDVYFAVKPEASANLLVFKENESSWAYLQLSLEYPDSVDGQLVELQTRYPGRNFQRLLGRGKGTPRIRVGALGIEQEGVWVPRQSGPALSQSILLNKKQTQVLMDARDAGISVEGGMEVYLPQWEVLETLALSPLVCDELFARGDTFQSVVIEYSKLASKIDKKSTRFPDTKEDLKVSLLRDCLEFSEPSSPMTSFQEFLKITLTPKTPRKSPKGETVRWGTALQTVPVEAEFPARVGTEGSL